MKFKSTLILAILIICTLLCITSCGKKASKDDNGEQASKTVYVGTTLELPEILKNTNTKIIKDEIIYAISESVDEVTGSNTKKLISAKIDGTDIKETPLVMPSENINTRAMAVTDSGEIYLVTVDYSQKLNPGDKDKYMLAKIENSALTIIGELAINSTDENAGFNDMYIDKENNVVLSCYDAVLRVYDINASPLFEIKAGHYIMSTAMTTDGKILLAYSSDTGREVSEVDMANKKLGKTYTVSQNGYSQAYLVSGADKYAFFVNDSTSLSGYNDKTEKFEKILEWLDSDIISDNISRIFPLSNGSFFCSGYSQSNQGEEYTVLKPMIVDKGKEARETITFAINYADPDILEAVVKFNKTNEKYRIKVIDYSQYNQSNDYEAGAKKLNTDMVSGKAPDIVDLNQLPLTSYISKGIITDLNKFLDNDKDIKREDYIENILKAMEQDGKLYSIAPGFSIMTVLGKKSVIGDKKSWTMQEMQDILKTMPEGTEAFANTTSETALYQMFYFVTDHFIDWEKGTCNFKNDEFKQILEFAKTLPQTIEYDDNYVDDIVLLKQDKALSINEGIYNMSEFMFTIGALKDDANFIGYPTNFGSGTVCVPTMKLAITEKSKHKDASWEFIKSLLESEKEPDRYYEIPLNKKTLQKIFDYAMTPETYTDEDGTVHESPKFSMGRGQGENEIQVECMAATQSDIDLLQSIIGSVESVLTFDMSIINIITEETAPFFAGQKTAQEVADVIENRVGTYLSEIQ